MIVHKLYRWSVDQINGRFISGWCFNRLHKTRPVDITVAADSTVIGRFINSGYRPDLVDLGLHPNGICAFDFSFPADFDPESFDQLHLFFDSSRNPLITFDCGDIELLRPRQPHLVCFMHIPKTAGTSFNSFARRCFDGTRFKTHIERCDAGQREQAARQADYLSGHLPLYELQRLPNITAFDFYSIIREPFAHLHSHLNYVKRVRPGSRVESLYTYRHNDTVKSLSDKLNTIDFTDPDAIGLFVSRLAGYERDFFDNLQTRYFLDYRPETVGQRDLDQAKQNLSRFCSVGLTEAYDAYRDRFCDDLGLAYQRQDLQSNKSAFYRLFDTSDHMIRDALAPLVMFDLDLYDHVSRQFWKKTDVQS